MPPTEGALPLVSMAVEFAHSPWVFKARGAKICIPCAVVRRQAAALVALELDEGETMLGAEILITHALISE